MDGIALLPQLEMDFVQLLPLGIVIFLLLCIVHLLARILGTIEAQTRLFHAYEEDEEDNEERPTVGGKRKGQSQFSPVSRVLMIFVAADHDEGGQPSKGKRMTTNKRSATNFYTTAVSSDWPARA